MTHTTIDIRSVFAAMILAASFGCSPSESSPSNGASDALPPEPRPADGTATNASASVTVDGATLDRFFAVMEAWRAKTRETGNEQQDLRNWQEALGAGEFFQTTLERNGFTDQTFAQVHQRVMEALTVLRVRGQVDFAAIERSMREASSGMSAEQLAEMEQAIAESKARVTEMEAADPALVDELERRRDQVDRLFGS